MVRRVCVLILGAALALAQEEKEDEGITIDEVPSGPEEEPERTGPYPAREPGTKVATVEIRKKVYSFVLPADWVLIEDDDASAEISWEVLLPGSTKRASLILARNDNFGDPRCAPYLQADWLRKDDADAKTEIRMKPYPRLLLRRPLNNTDWIDLFLWVSVRNNLYVFRLACAEADLPQAEEDLVAAVRSFSAKVEIWPPIPKGYLVSPEGTWLIARAPAVTASLSPLVKTLKDQEKRFRRDHGPLPKSDTPIVVLVHASQGDAARIDPGAAEGREGFWANERHRRLFATPLDKDNLERQGWLAGEAQALLFFARYGDISPAWVCNGESSVARAEAMTGKPLPALDEGFLSWASNLHLHTLGELDALRSAEKPDWGMLNTEAFFYVAMLHEGRYKKAYRAFLDAYAETGDGEGSFARHVAAVDQEMLRSATNDFIARIKPEKRKEKKPD